jgi:hypothetical protein
MLSYKQKDTFWWFFLASRLEFEQPTILTDQQQIAFYQGNNQVQYVEFHQ